MLNKRSMLDRGHEPLAGGNPEIAREVRRVLLELGPAMNHGHYLPPPARRAARAPEAMRIVGKKRSSFYAMQNRTDPAWDPSFPRPFPIGRRATAWFVDELEAWLEAQASRRTHSGDVQ